MAGKVSTTKGFSYYATTYTDDRNPVHISLEREITQFKTSIEKGGVDHSKHTRSANILFELWNKYEKLIPESTFEEKLVDVGDYLLQKKYCKLALWQCYDRYLQRVSNTIVEEITQEEDFTAAFFPGGFNESNVGSKFRALMGKAICTYQLIQASDPQLQKKETLSRCKNLLNFLRLITQIVLKEERFCWLVYNATIHIYSVCRPLMTKGYSMMILEYLIWCCSCMEMSFPLMTVRYLPWRSRLYTAVCQCLYDCKAIDDAEAYARRALAKIHELSELQNISSEPKSVEVESAFREATMKMAIMIFKRTVFESRRRPKGFLRPKNKINYKDMLLEMENVGIQWPRTTTEKLLEDMFEGSAAQMMCILESLRSTDKRIFQHGPPVGEHESELNDVYIELFLAAADIINGGGGKSGKSAPCYPSGLSAPLKGVHLSQTDSSGVPTTEPVTTLNLALQGDDGVVLNDVYQLIRWAFCYENWDLFETICDHLLDIYQGLHDKSEAMEAQMRTLLLMKSKKEMHLAHTMKKSQIQAQSYRNLTQKKIDFADGEGGNKSGGKKNFKKSGKSNKDENGKSKSRSRSPNKNKGDKSKSASSEKAATIPERDDLLHFAQCLKQISQGKAAPGHYDRDFLLDSILFLWKKCKHVLQRYQMGANDSSRIFKKMDSPEKWIFILQVVHQSLSWLGASTVDPALSGEVILRLALIMESTAMMKLERHDDDVIKSAGKSSGKANEVNFMLTDETRSPSILSRAQSAKRDSSPEGSKSGPENVSDLGILDAEPVELLQNTLLILAQGLRNVCEARTGVADNRGSNTADVSWNQGIYPENFQLSAKDVSGSSNTTLNKNEVSIVWKTVQDIHQELLMIYYKIAIQLIQLVLKGPNDSNPREGKKEESTKERATKQFHELYTSCNKNRVGRALLLMQWSLYLHSLEDDKKPKECDALKAEVSSSLIKAEQEIIKAMIEEEDIFRASRVDERVSVSSKTPPPPILLCRTDSSFTFRPAPWQPENGEKIAWYRLLGRSMKGANAKVRLNDVLLPGSGIEVPTFQCELSVHGLQPDEKYVFAVAAYTGDGKLIGDAIGASTKPILAMHPLSLLQTWAYLAQTAYLCQCFDVAQRGCEHLWKHFVIVPQTQEGILHFTKDENVHLVDYKINDVTIMSSSPVLLRQFLSSVLIHADIVTQEKDLFCDYLNANGLPIFKQRARLLEAERVSTVLDLCGVLNDPSMAAQTISTSYGLLAPFIQFKIRSKLAIKLLTKCLTFYTELPPQVRLRRSGLVQDSLQHMVACMTYYIAQTLNTWNEKATVRLVAETGRALLLPPEDEKADKRKRPSANEDNTNESIVEEEVSADMGIIEKALRKSKRGRPDKPGKNENSLQGKDEFDGCGPGCEELKAMESFIMSISKHVISPYMFDPKYWYQGQGTGDHALSGNEDASILHAYIAFLPSRIAYKEVSKFNRRPRFLQFFVQVMQLALSEGSQEQVIEWSKELQDWIERRNESLLGSRYILLRRARALKVVVGNRSTARIDDGAATISTGLENGTDKSRTKLAGEKDTGSVTESQRDAGEEGAATQVTSRKKKWKEIPTMKDFDFTKHKTLRNTANMSEEQKKALEEMEMNALDVLSYYLPDIIKQRYRRHRFRKIALDDYPYRVQMHCASGLAYLGVYLQKIHARTQALDGGSPIYKSDFLDPEWFTLDMSGAMIFTPAFHEALRNLYDVKEDDGTGATESGTDATQQTFQDEPMAARTKKKSIATIPNSDRLALRKASVNYTSTSTFKPSIKVKPNVLQYAAVAAMKDPHVMLMEDLDGQMDTGRDMDTSRTDMGRSFFDRKRGAPEDARPVITQAAIFETLESCFTNLKRAVVFAHRGELWTLLQNSCIDIWNTAHTALIHGSTLWLAAPSTQKQQQLAIAGGVSDGTKAVSSISFKLSSCMWSTFECAASALLDMILSIKENDKCKPGDPPLLPSLSGAENYHSGSSFRFDRILDETGCVDWRFIRKFVLRSLQLLYMMHKWERLITLAYRFNRITDYQFACDVSPLMLRAQSLLKKKLQEDYANEAIPESVTAWMAAKYELYDSQSMSLVIPKISLDIVHEVKHLYMTQRQLPFTTRSFQHSRRLLLLYLSSQCVSMDTSKDREALDAATNPQSLAKTQKQTITSFSLSRGPRKNLAPQRSDPLSQNKVSLSSKKKKRVGVFDVPDEPLDDIPLPLPADPNHVSADINEYAEWNEGIMKLPLHKEQLDIIISSYEKTIEMLISRQMTDAAAQAQRELGNLHFHMKNRSGAVECWKRSLNLILQTKDALGDWRNLLTGASTPPLSNSQQTKASTLTNAQGIFLKRCGIWGCIFGACVASNIAQYVSSTDSQMKTEWCLLAGHLFKSLFRGTLPHPVKDHEYALYDIGDGYETTFLVPGVNLFSDKFRCDVRSVEASLRFVIEQLHESGAYLFCLPLLSLYLYVAGQVCRDVRCCVFGRILRLVILTKLGYVAEACTTLIQLLWGDRLPQPLDSGSRRTETRVPNETFRGDKGLLEPDNVKLLDRLLTKRLSPTLSTLYGTILTCKLMLAHANFLSNIADTIQATPAFPDISGLVIHSLHTSQGDASKLLRTTRKVDPKLPVDEEYRSVIEYVVSSANTTPDHQGGTPISRNENSLSVELMKGLLLRYSADMLQAMLEAMTMSAKQEAGDLSSMSECELELYISCLLALAKVFRIRHNARIAARYAQKALKCLSTSRVLQQKSGTLPKSINPMQSIDSYEYFENFHSRARLTFTLWSQCRLTLIECLLAEVKGMGYTKGEPTKVFNDIPDVKASCLQGVIESEQSGNHEMKARFIFHFARLAHMHGKSGDKVTKLYEEALKSLEEVNSMAQEHALLIIQTRLQLVDLMLLNVQDDSDTRAILLNAWKEYQLLHDRLLQCFESWGEIIQWHQLNPDLSTPKPPLKNVFNKWWLLLIHIKLRLGHTLALYLAMDPKTSFTQAPQLWLTSFCVLATALELSFSCVSRSPMLESEILLQLGKIQRLFSLKSWSDHKNVSQLFCEGLDIVVSSTGDLGCSRELYQELNVLFLEASKSARVSAVGSLLPVPGSHKAPRNTSASPSRVNERLKAGQVPRRSSVDTKSQAALLDAKRIREELAAQEAAIENRYIRSSWLSLRCVHHVAQAEDTLLRLRTECSDVLNEVQISHLPEFLLCDLYGAYVVGERKMIYKNEIEEVLSEMPESQLAPESERTDDQLRRMRLESKECTWSILIGYLRLIRQLCWAKGIGRKLGESNVESASTTPDKAGSRVVVRPSLWSDYWQQRWCTLHQYLYENLPIYRQQCAPLPVVDLLRLNSLPIDFMAMLQEVEDALKLPLEGRFSQSSSLALVSYQANWISPSSVEKQSPGISSKTPDPTQMLTGEMSVPRASVAIAPPSVSVDYSHLIKTIVESAGLDTSVKASVERPPPLPGCLRKLVSIPSEVEEKLLATTENEICFQFYRPNLDPMCCVRENDQIFLLFNSTRKVDRKTTWLNAVGSGLHVISLTQTLLLSERLHHLSHEVDLLVSSRSPISTGTSKDAAATLTSTGGATASRNKAGTETTSSKLKASQVAPAPTTIKLDLPLNRELRLCLDELVVLLDGKQSTKFFPDQSADLGEASMPELPFDVSKENVYALKCLLDTYHGGVVKTGKLYQFILEILNSFTGSEVVVDSQNLNIS